MLLDFSCFLYMIGIHEPEKEIRIMSKQCEICGKKPIKAAKLTFSHKQIVHTQEPNLQSVKVNMNGTVKRIKVCTSCLRAGKVQKAV